MAQGPSGEQFAIAFAIFTSHDRQLGALQPVRGSAIPTHRSSPSTKHAFLFAGHSPSPSGARLSVIVHAATTMPTTNASDEERARAPHDGRGMGRICGSLRS